MRYVHPGYPGQHAGDDWCVNNSRDNIALNHIDNITVELGDASLLEGRKPFDVIIANINRNILLNDLPAYAACMHSGSEIYMSGFYVEDIPAIREKGESLGMRFVHTPPRKAQLGSRKAGDGIRLDANLPHQCP